jgi:hypothetical protein
VKVAALETTAVFGAVPCGGETVEEELVPLLPGSEQLRLQHSRAIEACGVLLADCAFLQQSGMLVIGQEPSCSCAPTPTMPPSMATTRVRAVSHFRIDVVNYIDRLRCVSSRPISVSGPELKRNTVSRAGISPALQHHSELMPTVCVIQKRMDSYAVEENGRTPAVAQSDV